MSPMNGQRAGADGAPVPTPEQEQRVKWDLLILDLEMRGEQVRQLRRYEPLRLAAQLMTASVVAGSGAAALVLWVVHLLR